ncbi:alpha/beta hydrolase [Coraliomargarita sp. SDUM461003]|uniref:Alpha/beta hydrolase n=1 Tax=Thalassobacterium maritimum TaxID=3041265 RepID=A0ABU1AYL1_9BACT|nr:alpha/beta hydrolase [Coraliomargarita sp. SDUM461003]MDQ8209248.1 alpha/beta hydrolase [Coraliomargarita sp. SDUM461003]
MPQLLTLEQTEALLDLQGHEPCPGVEIELKRKIGSIAGGPELYAAIYRPSTVAATPAPALLAFHGGGWENGAPESYGEMAKMLALSLGMITVSVSYRLADAHNPTFPYILDEASHAWQWLQTHATELGINPQQVAVTGASAGVFQATHLAVDSPLVSFSASTSRPAALIANWGPLDFVARWFDKHENPGAERTMLGTDYQRNPALYHRSSPITYMHGDLPPALFIYGRQDRTVHARQGAIGHAAWQAADAHSELIVVDNIGHDIVGDNRAQRAEYLQAAVGFLEARLLPQSRV